VAYDYLGLVNGVLARVNETPLTSSTFASATGFYADVKQAVNLAISDINTIDFSWPFNHTTETETLVVDQVRYDLPADVKHVAWETFRIRGDDTLQVNTTKLVPMDYEQYLNKWSDVEYRPSVHRGIPTNVFRCRNNTQFGVINPPNKAYVLDYEYYSIPTALVDYDDVPSVPQIFEHVIHSGAMSYAYAFRGDVDLHTLTSQLFRDQIKNMRIIYINRTDYVATTERIR
jgi:hypothetical protein